MHILNSFMWTIMWKMYALLILYNVTETSTNYYELVLS